MERRRSLRLLEKETEKKKAKMDAPSSRPETSEPIIQNSPIFDSKVRDVLPNIINNLDPGSFVKLARTCKEMNHICFNNKEIHIPCWDRKSAFGYAGATMSLEASNFVLITTKPYKEFSADRDFVKKLAQMPFVFHFDLQIWNAADDRILRELRSYFLNFPRFVIFKFCFQVPFVDDWEGLVEFVKDFRIDALHVYMESLDDRRVEAPSLEILTFLTQNLSGFASYLCIPDDIILRATTKNLTIRRARISKETFKELIKKFAAGEILRWKIGREEVSDDDEHGDDDDDVEDEDDDEVEDDVEVEDVIDDDEDRNDGDDDDDIEDEEADEVEADPFIAAVYEVMNVVEVEDIDRNAMEPSTAYFTPDEPYEFSILKSDGSLGYFVVFPHLVILGK